MRLRAMCALHTDARFAERHAAPTSFLLVSRYKPTNSRLIAAAAPPCAGTWVATRTFTIHCRAAIFNVRSTSIVLKAPLGRQGRTAVEATIRSGELDLSASCGEDWCQSAPNIDSRLEWAFGSHSYVERPDRQGFSRTLKPRRTVRSYVRPFRAAVTAGHDEFRGTGVSDHFCALIGALSQTDCPMSGFRPLRFITRRAPLRQTRG